jgi:hypothetical protein
VAERKIENYFMQVGYFAFHPILRNGVVYIKVAYAPDERYKSCHIADSLVMTETTMPDELVNEYYPILVRNQDLILEGLRHA